ncbi:MAG: thioredoxin domain-containing protein, partial [Brachybacterium sp.]|nr:thioredoxin domain-containing protein [Brachybacterium sp.]
MAASGSSSSGQDRRAQQREKLRKQRQAELKRQRRARAAVIAAISVLALVVVAGIGYLIYDQTRPPEPVAYPQGVAEGQTYLPVGAESGAPEVDLYLDFMCPFCGQLHQTNSEDLDQIVSDDEATLRFHMRTFLDSQSTSGDYSSRAANAATCVWEDDPENFMAFQDEVFDHQPEEGSDGIPDEQLWEYA